MGVFRVFQKKEWQLSSLTIIFAVAMANIIEIKNKKASYQYFLIEEYVAGIQLTGTEIKSIRDGKANIADAYCLFIDNELYVREMHIAI